MSLTTKTIVNQTNNDSGLSLSLYAWILKKSYLWKVENGDRINLTLSDEKEVEIMEVYAMKGHIHMLLKILPKLSVSSFMR